MAQTEDTELRDLVIEALEKNGSLAKIRALLRANIFLAFEDDCENIKQNANLDEMLRVPEGIISLSIIHEFLEFCNLKNTLFVYVSESRQGKQYSYEGQKFLAEKFKFCKKESAKEPTLLSLVRQVMKTNSFEDEDKSERDDGVVYKDDQNCTYIMHDSSGSTSNSQTDSSSDEKNKQNLRLQLDHSDTDTSSDSMRERLSSEYIPNEHIAKLVSDEPGHKGSPTSKSAQNQQFLNITDNKIGIEPHYQTFSLKKTLNSSSDSTSYIEIKPPDINGKSPIQGNKIEAIKKTDTSNSNDKTDSGKSNTTSQISSMSNKSNKYVQEQKPPAPSVVDQRRSDTDVVDYSLDFSSYKETENVEVRSPQSVQEDVLSSQEKNTSLDSPNQNSPSSRSSISISDVADLLSENSPQGIPDKRAGDNQLSSTSKKSLKSPNFESGDFSESSVPSLSNLSLEIHSD